MSYVRRWIKGERIPSLKSDYVEKISACILNGRDKKTYENYIIQLNYDTKEELLDILREAQIYSLQASKKTFENCNNKSYSILKRPESKRTLNNILSFIKGKEEVFKYVSIIFKAAYQINNEEDKNILMTFQGNKDIFDGYEKNHDYFINGITKLIKFLGWVSIYIAGSKECSK